MKIKRSKQYRKLMNQYQLNFGFREPYQVIVDADMLRDADRFKMDLVGGLERTLQGQVKPMITQCSMRHLYAAAKETGVSYIIDKAKTYERRRCGHLPADYPEPLSTETCLTSVVDSKNNKTNKHRYVVASQDMNTRKAMREILGVPLVYINRSVMIMEPMAEKTVDNREREERGKFRDGLKRGSGSLKRKREEGDDEQPSGETKSGESVMKKKKTVRGPKGPNPLAVKKAKKKPEEGKSVAVTKSQNEEGGQKHATQESKPQLVGTEGEETSKRKRKRKHKSGAATSEGQTVVETASDAGSE